MKITNAKIADEHGKLIEVEISILEGRIAQVLSDPGRSADGGEIVDLQGAILSSGWIDLQINGAFGCDFTSDPDSIWQVGARLPESGVTGFLPTIISAGYETYQKAIETLKKGPPKGWSGAIPLGWHFEGPFLNLEKKGAHNPDFLHLPDAAFIKNWSRANGVWLVTMAPELDPAGDTTARLISDGIVLSAGHTAATMAEMQRAVEAGFTAVTHLFNAMTALDHRNPGIIGEIFVNDRVYAGLIADGIHVHPRMIEITWKLISSQRMVLVTDAVGAMGFAPGTYEQGGLEIVVTEEAARLKNGTLAGSVLRMDQALRNMMRFTRSNVEQILPALGANQARLLKMPDSGEIKPGYRANLTAVDPSGRVTMTMVDGKILYSTAH